MFSSRGLARLARRPAPICGPQPRLPAGGVQRVTRISRQIKAIAREYDVPVLALSQLNRSTEQREDRHPRLSDIRESGAVEQDADIVIGLYRETLDSRRIDLEILKNRQGPVGRLTIDFDLRSLTIRDAA